MSSNSTTTLVVGATGATGKLLVEQLLAKGGRVRAIVRSAERLPESTRNNERLSIIEGAVLDLSDDEMKAAVAGCTAICSCLGHNMSFSGMFGHPRRLVTDATRRLCDSVKAVSSSSATPVRFVLMNTVGNQGAGEQVSKSQSVVLTLLRWLVPPHTDNEMAAAYLHTEIGNDNDTIEYCIVRPDALVDEPDVTAYEVYDSPQRSAIFNSGQTSRINVARFMLELANGGGGDDDGDDDDELWQRWKGKMPVVYNEGHGKEET